MQLPLAYYGNSILRKKGAPVTKIDDEIHQLIEDMIETMHAYDGIGLAAPQVNRSLALFITEVPIQTGEDSWDPGTVRAFINPKIISHSKEDWFRSEGCLSIPQVFGEVCRPLHIRVQATAIDGTLFEEDFSGLNARAIMHESDHIHGILFIDRIHGKKRKEMEAALQRVKKKFSVT